MNVDLNAIFDFVFTAVLGYFTWTFKDRETRMERRFASIEQDVREARKTMSESETRMYKDFVTREQHDIDINAVMKKLDETNRILMEVYKDIGKLIGRERKDG